MADKTAGKLLLRNLGTREAIGIVVGSIVGTGVFLKTAIMAQQAGSPLGVLLAWVVAGVLSLMGALTYAELGALFPQTGGEYIFLREAYGPFAAYLYGWTRFWIATPASIAAYAIGAATFLGGLLSLGGQRAWVAALIIGLFSAINCFSVAFNGRFQAVMTATKVIMIVGLSAALLGWGGGDSSLIATESRSVLWPTFGAAVLSALWAFDGWNNLPMAAGEIRDPGRVLPRALVWGTLLVLFIYGAANIAYFYVLSFEQIATSSSTAHPEALPVATRAAQMVFGPWAVGLLSIMFVFSAVGAMNGSILTGARVPYAMACDRLFFAPLARVHAISRVPALAVAVQGVFAMILALMGTFDQLTDYVVFTSWIFYALMAAALFVFRVRLPAAPRPFRVPGYPWLPVIFLVSSVVLLLNTLWTSPRESAIGVGLITLGIPFYFLWFRNTDTSQESR